MKKTLECMFLWLCGLVATAVQAAPSVVTTCNGCSDLAARDAATNALYAVRANGYTTPYIYVWNESANTMMQYDARINAREGLVAHLIGPAPSDIQNAYEKAKTAIAANRDSTLFHYYIPYSDRLFPSRDAGLNGYQFAMASQAQNDISDVYMNSFGLNESGPMDFIYKVFTGNSPFSVTLTIILMDGSRITMTFNGQKFVVTEARDGANNNIPLSNDQVPGTYRGSNDGSGISGYMHDRFGAGITISGNVSCTNHYTMACTSGGGIYHCDLVRCP